ncbi:MAG: hypothetical protein EPO24_11305 [Bacteroidetes bacterium]|nr:MAG: hypothetical protein EPO24_11305 [Bacteroidota bacterium]
MKNKKIVLTVLFGVMVIAITLSLTGCMGGSYMRVSANIVDQPIWGPVGYEYVHYYYIPDIDCYYSVPDRQYIYWNGSVWIYSASLPAHYRYDPYYSYKVVITGNRSYEDHEIHRQKYGKYKGKRSQEIIRDSRDSKYFEHKEHPEHRKWARDRKR